MIRILFVAAFLLINPFSAIAAEVQTVRIYADIGDGNISTSPYPGSWSEQYNSGLGRTADYEKQFFYSQVSKRDEDGYLEITRAFISFDTSIIPDDALITSATLNLFNVLKGDTYNDDQNYFGLQTSGHQSETSLVDSDINTCDTEGLVAEKIYVNDITLDAYNTVQLNQLGLDNINKIDSSKFCLREGHDIENQELQKLLPEFSWDYITAHFSSVESEGLDRDPYLEIIYEIIADEMDISREEFLQLVILATDNQKKPLQKFFLRQSNHIFDLIERGKDRRALIELRVLTLLLKAKNIQSDDLSDAIKDLRQQLKK